MLVGAGSFLAIAVSLISTASAATMRSISWNVFLHLQDPPADLIYHCGTGKKPPSPHEDCSETVGLM
jgi:hypothetical protein